MSIWQISKLVFLIAGLRAVGYNEGVGAYYHQVDLREVCRYRVEQGWNPGLDCAWDCLAAWGRHEPDMLGTFVLADLPGGDFRLCQVVDVRQEIHEAENGHIIIEIDGQTAAEAGWVGYTEGVRVWRLMD